MKRHDAQRLGDIEAAVAAIEAHMDRRDLSDGLVFDAEHAIVAGTVANDLGPLMAAVGRLKTRLLP